MPDPIIVTRHDGWAGIATFGGSFTRIEQQTTLGLVGFDAVTLVAFVDQDGFDLLLEKFELVWRNIRGGGN